MSVIPELRSELIAMAARQSHAGTRSAWRPPLGGGRLGLALGAAAAVVVALAAVLTLAHRPTMRGQQAASAGVRAFQTQLAVLRRPQTAADRTLPRALVASTVHVRVIAPLTRLAATLATSELGTIRVYVFVFELAHVPRAHPAQVALAVIAVDAHGNIQGRAVLRSAAELSAPAAVQSGSSPRASAITATSGASIAVIPDGVTRVRWVFSGAGLGVTHPHPLSITPHVAGNVAIAPVQRSQGPIDHAVWYSAGGHVIASGAASSQSREQLHQINAINTSRTRSIAPELIAHYRLFRSVSPIDLAHDSGLATPALLNGGAGGGLDLNYWQTRYVPSVTGIDGPGLWITPGTHGLCISDPQAGTCGGLSHAGTTGVIGATSGGPPAQTLTGLVPDGNPTITVILANGTHRTVSVTNNVYETTVPVRIIAILVRDTNGNIKRLSLG